MVQRTSRSVLADNGWATRWRCQCGYDNTGRDLCLICNLPAPDDIRGAAELPGGPRVRPPLYGPQVRPPLYGPPVRTGTKANRTVMGFIAANVVLQVGELVYFVANDVPRASAVKVSLFSGLALYALATLWVLARSRSLEIRPSGGLQTAAVGAAEGFVVRGAAAVLMVAGLRLLTGHPVLDPATALLASQGSLSLDPPIRTESVDR